MAEGNWDTYGVFEKNISQVKNKIIPIKSNSVDAAKDFDKQIDFLFIDGDHSFQGCLNDMAKKASDFKTAPMLSNLNSLADN